MFRHYLAAPEDVYMFLGDAGDYRVPLIKGHDAGLTTFTKPNTDFTVALEFDESKFSAMVTTGKGVFYLSSGYEYTFQTNYASEVVILLEPISEFDTNVSGEIRYELTGVETESGSPTGLAAVCILMSVLVFAVLFLSNRKPHW